MSAVPDNAKSKAAAGEASVEPIAEIKALLRHFTQVDPLDAGDLEYKFL